VNGGIPVGTEDVGYGPARVLYADKVAELNVALSAFSEQTFEQRFDPKVMLNADIYPQIWNDSREDLLKEYRGYFDDLKVFVKSATQTSEALLITVR
jgi:hypothetical protein